jgi:hypothetical protein
VPKYEWRTVQDGWLLTFIDLIPSHQQCMIDPIGLF